MAAGLAALSIALGLVVFWETSLLNDSPLVVYFGRPRNIIEYVSSNAAYLAWAAGNCFLSACLSLLLASLCAVLMLSIGLLRDGWLKRIEYIAASLQTVPFLVIVTVFLLAQRALFEAIEIHPSTTFYSIIPVALSLSFPPIVYGAKAIIRTQIQIKSLLRLWQAPVWWRIGHVYLPSAIPDILTGVRTSATWAVGATLISDGLVDGVEINARTLGHLLIRPFSSAPAGQTPTVVIVSTLLAFLVYYLVARIQFVIERWTFGTAVQSEEAYSLQRD